MTSLKRAAAPVVPDEIARAVVLPESYATEDFYGTFKWLRANMPIGLARVDGYDPLWLITKHADIKTVERQPHLFHNCDDQNPILQDRASDALQRTINDGKIRILDDVSYMGPDEHRKHRALLHDWFMPPNVRKFEDRIRGHARDAVEQLMSTDGECDLVQEFALFYPLRVIMELLGVPREDEPMMLRLTQEVFAAPDPDRQQHQELEADPIAAAKMALAAVEEFTSYFDALADNRRANPKDDLATRIATAELDGEPLSASYQRGWYITIATAGHDTTSSSIAGGILGLIRHPDQLAKLRADGSLIPGFVDESLRYATAIKHFMRSTTEDTELNGVFIAKGERQMLCYPSGNRDEDVFDHPDDFDVTRHPNRHISFGHGPHVCLGVHVSKLEMRVLYEELVPRLKSIELAGAPEFTQTNFIGGLKSLPVRFQKA